MFKYSNHLGLGLSFAFSCLSLTKLRVYDLSSGGRLIFCTMTRVTDFDGDKRQLSTISGLPIDMSFASCMNFLDFLTALRTE